MHAKVNIARLNIPNHRSINVSEGYKITFPTDFEYWGMFRLEWQCHQNELKTIEKKYYGRRLYLQGTHGPAPNHFHPSTVSQPIS